MWKNGNECFFADSFVYVNVNVGQVAKLATQLASYVSYASPGMSDEELEGYECITKNVTDSCSCVLDPLVKGAKCPSECITAAWWGNFSGPCCRPKSSRREQQLLS
jgi:hypothetical protein